MEPLFAFAEPASELAEADRFLGALEIFPLRAAFDGVGFLVFTLDFFFELFLGLAFGLAERALDFFDDFTRVEELRADEEVDFPFRLEDDRF